MTRTAALGHSYRFFIRILSLSRYIFKRCDFFKNIIFSTFNFHSLDSCSIMFSCELYAKSVIEETEVTIHLYSKNDSEYLK